MMETVTAGPRRFLPPIVAACLAMTAVAWASPARAETQADSRIATAVARLAQDPALGRNLGVHVRDVTSDRSVTGIRADRGFIPASTMKVVTAFTSLASLGADHRFVTTVWMPAPGRLVLEGGGDPVLTRSDLSRLAKKTKRKLKKKDLPLRVVVDYDDDIFAPPTNAPGWEAGDMPAYISAVRGLTILGSYSADTSRVAADAFVAALRARKVQASVGSRADAESGATRLARFRGNDVGEAIAVMMPPSENNVAEILFRHVALDAGRQAGWEGASRAAVEVLDDEGIDVGGSTIVDGSGLSYSNRLTPELLTDVLSKIDVDERFAAARDSMPIAGVNGTLVRRFAAWPASCARGEVSAKTGSLPMTVSTLAGFTTGADGRRKAFAVLVNDRPYSAAWSATSLAIDSIAAAVHGCVR